MGKLRKMTRSRSEADSMSATHSGSEPLAATAKNATAAASAVAMTVARMRTEASRNDFNVHPLRADVMGDIFRGNGQAINAGRKLIRDLQVAGAGGSPGIPFQV